MTADELKPILDAHGRWLRGENDGSRAVLRGADLSGATGKASIDPIPDIRSKLLAAVSADGCKLDMQSWHTCDTTHCLAGWVVTIHPQGKLLEYLFDTGTAAALILDACGEAIPDFYDTSDGGDARAMNWLRTGSQTNPEPVQPGLWPGEGVAS
jgi:hypothetical protein